MARQKKNAVDVERSEPTANELELSRQQYSGSLPDDAVIVQLRASIRCAEKCQLLLTVDEVASVLRIDTVQAVRLINTKQLTSIIFGGRELVAVRELVDFIEVYSNIAKRSSI